MASENRVASGYGADNNELSLSDVICPICLSILIEPVTMPCYHSLCMPCFNQHVTQTSLACPVCRKRISVWVRRNTKTKKLVNTRLWQKIRDNFAAKVEARIHGDDEPDSEEFVPVHHVSAPGEIRQEYEALLADELQEVAVKRSEEEILSNRLIQQLQDEEKMQLRERRKQQEHLEQNDAVVAQQMKEEEQKELKKRVNGNSVILSKLGQTPKKSVATPAYGPLDVYIDRKMTATPMTSKDISNTPTASASISGNSITTCSRLDNSSKTSPSPVLSDSTDCRSRRQLREITSSQSSESEPEDSASASWLSSCYLKIPGKENMQKQRRKSPCKLGKEKGKSLDCRTKRDFTQCSPDIDSYNGIFRLNSDHDSEKDKDSDETDIEEELIISKTAKTRTGGEDKVIEMDYDCRPVYGDLQNRKHSMSESSNNNNKDTSVYSEECDVPASKQNLEYNTQTELTSILSDEEISAESLAALVAEQRMVEARLRQEEEDRHLAETLQRELNQQMRQVNRSRGSEDEYILRNRKTSVSTSSKVVPSKAKKSSYHKKARQPTIRESIAKRHKTS